MRAVPNLPFFTVNKQYQFKAPLSSGLVIYNICSLVPCLGRGGAAGAGCESWSWEPASRPQNALGTLMRISFWDLWWRRGKTCVQSSGSEAIFRNIFHPPVRPSSTTLPSTDSQRNIFHSINSTIPASTARKNEINPRRL